MSFWVIIQVVLNIGLIGLGLVIWARVSRPQKDDPRLSRGLQLLQSKIAILEDLSDRTDHQVKQLTQYMDEKSKEIEQKVNEAQEHINKVEKSIEKSLEVSKIFQDKIPHKEIIERQNTLKYIQAARLAHQGMSAQEISQKIDIPMSELEFIVKVNKTKLVFSEDQLPEWVQNSLENYDNINANQVSEPVIKPSLARNMNWSFENANDDYEKKIEESEKVHAEFKKAVAVSEEKIKKDIPIELSLPDLGIETALESQIHEDDLKTSIQKAKDLLNKTMDKTFDMPKVELSSESASQKSDKIFSSANKSQAVIKKENSDSVRSFQFKRIETI